MTDIVVKRLDKKDWATLSEKAHLVVFNENRPESLNRIDYALLCLKGEEVLVYVTIKELDAESVYWQYGGAFPTSKKSPLAFKCFKKLLDYCAEQNYCRVSFYVKNDNFSMLKFSLAHEFKAIGMRNFAGDIFLEMHKEIKRSH